MFDFPNTPTVGQQAIEPNGAVVQWDGVKWTSVAGQLSSVTPTYNNVGRNLLHNGLFNVWQRGAGPWTASNAYTADRWVIGANLDTVSVAALYLTDAGRTAIGDESVQWVLQNTFTGNASAASYNDINQRIERVKRLSGKTVTISFWALAGAAGLKLGVSLSQIFGTGGSPSANVNINGQAVALTTTWTRYSLTFSLPSASGMTLGSNGDDYTALWFWYSGGASANALTGNIGVQSGTISIWGVQLEIGSTATPLEKIDPGEDLRRCQRFYQLVQCNARVNASAVQSIATPSVWATMRATPTVALVTAGSNSNSGSISLTAQTAFGGNFGGASLAAGDAYALGYTYGLSADL